MLDPEIDLVPQSSPSISSISSSDFDSESTGSFFHDRSTSLGTLMGVSFPSIRVSSHREQQHNSINNNSVSNGFDSTSEGERKKKKKKKKKKSVVVVETEKNRRWWKLCRDDVVKSASLADYLEVERRFDDGEYYGVAAEFEGVVIRPSSSSGNGTNGRLLFADGRVLPPSASTTRTEVVVPQTNTVAALCRFPILITGICSGGGVSRGSGV